MAASFASTLRAFASKEPAERSRLRPSLAPANPQRRPLTTLGSLQRGPERIAEKKSPPPPSPAVAAVTEKASPKKKAPVERKALPPRSALLLARVWNWLQKQRAFPGKKQLRVCETVSLGEKRFVAVVQIEGQKFLIGGGATGVSLLAELDNEAELESNAVPESKAALEASLALDGEDAAKILQPIACAGGRSR